MHLFITLKPEQGFEISVHYNHLLQGMIYETIDPELAAFLHDQGYQSGSRRFKLFAYSRLGGDFEINKQKNTIRYTEDIRLAVSSPVSDFCQSIANGLLTKGQIRLGNSYAEIAAITVEQLAVKDERVVLRTLSPIVTYSTLERPDGRKYTCYFQPGDPDYNSLIENNLRKKYRAFYKEDAPAGAVTVRNIGAMKMNIVEYKGFIIKGYSGRVEIAGPRELLQMAVDGGVGSKNSQGFGCVEMVRG